MWAAAENGVNSSSLLANDCSTANIWTDTDKTDRSVPPMEKYKIRVSLLQPVSAVYLQLSLFHFSQNILIFVCFFQHRKTRSARLVWFVVCKWRENYSYVQKCGISIWKQQQWKQFLHWKACDFFRTFNPPAGVDQKSFRVFLLYLQRDKVLFWGVMTEAQTWEKLDSVPGLND